MQDPESRLRQALRSRATEVTGHPDGWTRVQRRVRLLRRRRLALAATGMTAAVAAAAAIAAAALVGAPRVRFDPPPAGPGRSPAATGAPADPCAEHGRTAAVLSHRDDLWVACAEGGFLPLVDGTVAVERNPTVSPDGRAVVYERHEPGADHPVLVRRGLSGQGDREVLGAGTLPAFAADGRLAWVEQPQGGRAVIRVTGRQATGSAATAAAVTGATRLPVPGAGPIRALHWDPSEERLLYTAGTGGDVAAYAVDPEGGDHRLLLPAESSLLALAVAPDGTVGGLARTASGGLSLGLIDRRDLDGTATYTTHGVIDVGELIDAAGERLFLASAGWAAVYPLSDVALGWRAASGMSWFVADGEHAYLVTADGRATHLSGFVDSVALNPALDIPPRLDATRDARITRDARDARDRAVADVRARLERLRHEVERLERTLERLASRGPVRSGGGG